MVDNFRGHPSIRDADMATDTVQMPFVKQLAAGGKLESISLRLRREYSLQLDLKAFSEICDHAP